MRSPPPTKKKKELSMQMTVTSFTPDTMATSQHAWVEMFCFSACRIYVLSSWVSVYRHRPKLNRHKHIQWGICTHSWARFISLQVRLAVNRSCLSWYGEQSVAKALYTWCFWLAGPANLESAEMTDKCCTDVATTHAYGVLVKGLAFRLVRVVYEYEFTGCVFAKKKIDQSYINTTPTAEAGRISL